MSAILDDFFGTASVNMAIDIKDIVTCNTQSGPRDYHLVAKVVPTTNYQSYFVGYNEDLKQFIVLDDMANLITDKDITSRCIEDMKFLVHTELNEAKTIQLGVYY